MATQKQYYIEYHSKNLQRNPSSTVM